MLKTKIISPGLEGKKKEIIPVKRLIKEDLKINYRLDIIWLTTSLGISEKLWNALSTPILDFRGRRDFRLLSCLILINSKEETTGKGMFNDLYSVIAATLVPAPKYTELIAVFPV